jgi:MYXO-CTERM domain-containing protein
MLVGSFKEAVVTAALAEPASGTLAVLALAGAAALRCRRAKERARSPFG